MLRLLVLNDIHIGVNRNAGTTQESRHALKLYLQTNLCDILNNHPECDVVINGDLFDAFDVDLADLRFTLTTFINWLKATGNKLHLVQGNHDIAKNSTKCSSFHFLCGILMGLFPDKVNVYIGGLTRVEGDVWGDVWVIPHCVNQDAFNEELERALVLDRPSHILLHANLDNHFAVEADHSLNVSKEWVSKLVQAGHKLLFAHEHQHRTAAGGNVIVFGNQWPSSVSDCLSTKTGQKDQKKYAHVLRYDHHNDGILIEMIPTWYGDADYEELDWTELSWNASGADFIRVTGKATQEQASDVISAVAKLRKESKAFVVANAVQIEGLKGIEEMTTLTQEKLGSMDIKAALKEELDESEVIMLDWLLEKRDAQAA
jgi:metallophosphoesterase superfamily enzyme